MSEDKYREAPKLGALCFIAIQDAKEYTAINEPYAALLELKKIHCLPDIGLRRHLEVLWHSEDLHKNDVKGLIEDILERTEFDRDYQYKYEGDTNWTIPGFKLRSDHVKPIKYPETIDYSNVELEFDDNPKKGLFRKIGGFFKK